MADLKNKNPNAMNELDSDLENTTGLALNTDANGNLTYETEKGFLGIKRAKVKRDKNGKKIGSRKARRRIRKAIKNKKTVVVKDNAGGSNYVPGLGANEINFDIDEIHMAMNAASPDLNPLTLGPALMFIHELGHTGVGGSSDDPSAKKDSKVPGANSRRVNRIRRQLGKDYGVRRIYGYILLNRNYYMPYSRQTQKQLESGKVPTSMYMKF